MRALTESNIKACPCCHSANVTSGKVANKKSKSYIKCNDCGHEITGDTLETLVETWNVSKEDHVRYVPKVLIYHGNCFISQRTRDIWEGYDLEAYLSNLTGKPVTIRDCIHMEDGCVAEMKLY